MVETLNSTFFRFKVEGESGKPYVIPQSVVDGSDTITFTTNWSRENLPGSTEPMVAYNFTDAPTIPINLKFHEDMWRENNMDTSGYLAVINKFASLAYPGNSGNIIKPPYCIVYYNNRVYRGYFTNIRITQTGIMRNGYKINCEISGNFTIIKRQAPIARDLAQTGYRVYFSDEMRPYDFKEEGGYRQ